MRSRPTEERALEGLLAALPDTAVDDTGIRLGRAGDDRSARALEGVARAMVRASVVLERAR